jgi:hypothetical protein
MCSTKITMSLITLEELQYAVGCIVPYFAKPGVQGKRSSSRTRIGMTASVSSGSYVSKIKFLHVLKLSSSSATFKFRRLSYHWYRKLRKGLCSKKSRSLMRLITLALAAGKWFDHRQIILLIIFLCICDQLDGCSLKKITPCRSCQ